jgi:uncharacterized membrane protein YdjX (TVP38/TMEM64 family)
MSSAPSRAGLAKLFLLAVFLSGAAALLFGVKIDVPIARGTLADLDVETSTGRVTLRAFTTLEAFGPGTPVAEVLVSPDHRLVSKLVSRENSSAVEAMQRMRADKVAGSARETQPTGSYVRSLGGSVPVRASLAVRGDLALLVSARSGEPASASDPASEHALGDAVSSLERSAVLLPGWGRDEPRSLWASLRTPNGGAALAFMLEAFLSRIGWLGPVLYVALYLAGTLVAFPGSVLTIAGGFAFGLWTATLLVTIGANLGASAAFLFARYVARGAIEKKLPARLQSLNRDLEARGVRTVLFLRLVPLFPFNMINYVCGLSRLRYRDFLVGSVIGMVPGTFLWIYAARSAVSLSLTNPLTWVPLVLFVVMLLVPRLYRKWRSRDRSDPEIAGAAL